MALIAFIFNKCTLFIDKLFLNFIVLIRSLCITRNKPVCKTSCSHACPHAIKTIMMYIHEHVPSL